VKAGRLWLDTSTGVTGTLKKRNAANDGWDTLINFDVVVPAAHAPAHEDEGSDEIDVTGLSGVLADPQIADKVRESSGPTTLTVGAVADGQILKRSGSAIIGTAAGVGGVGDVVGPGSATDNALARFDSTTGKLIQNSTVTLDDTGAFTVPEMAAPPAPASGKVAVYAKVDGLVYSKDDAGTEKLLSGGVIPFEFTVAVSDESTAITTGAAKITFYFPVAVNITGVSAGLSTQSSSGAITIDVNKGGTTIFSTNLTIDANEDTSHTAATPAALTSSPTAFALTDKVTIDIDGAGTGAKGLKVSFTGTRQ
jgi:hypothetical protein